MAALIAISACNKVETKSMNPGTRVAFRTNVDYRTRAADLGSNLEKFTVSAVLHPTEGGTASIYFSDALFSRMEESGTYSSTHAYYWPKNGSLDFYAHAPQAGEGSQVRKDSINRFTIHPDETASSNSQVDFIFAYTGAQTLAESADGVPLTFMHTQSKIVLKAKNSQPNLKFVVEAVKLANVSTEGTYTYDITEEQAGNWTASEPYMGKSYLQEFQKTSIAAAAGEAQKLGNELILIPQSRDKATAYNAEKLPNGSYIGVKTAILNSSDNSLIWGQRNGDAITGEWVIFPADFKWESGKIYTYIIDLAGGGYQPQQDEDAQDDNLEEVLPDQQIIFINVNVTDWITTEARNII